MPVNFKVSVIVPVYNAEKYLRKAVASAEALAEVEEIILIEDKSPDNALVVCHELVSKYNKVKLYQHPDKGNHGAGASRNLGIQKSRCEYISFLDADDYYLPNRFVRDKEVFANHENCDGVYSAVGTHFHSKAAKDVFFNQGLGYQETLTLSDSVPPEELFSVLFSKHKTVTGEFCTDGITLKKSVFLKVGLFNTKLRLRQDIHLWRRLAGFCNLYAGQIDKPTAMRVIHEQNRMTVKEDHSQYIDLWWQSLKTEFKVKHLDKTKYKIFEQAYYNYKTAHSNKLKSGIALFQNVLKYPRIVLYPNEVFDFNFWKVFGKNWLSLHLISFKNRSLRVIRIQFHNIKTFKPIKAKLSYPIERNHFYNKDLNYFISANSKVMSSTLGAAKNLEQANLKILLRANIKKKITGRSDYQFYLLVRNPTKRLESYYKNFFGLRVDRLGKTHSNLEYSHVAILKSLGYEVNPEDLKYKAILSKLTFFDIVKVLPSISDKDSHLIPQSYLLKWHYGRFKSKLKMDRILKMENEQDLGFIADVLKIDVSNKSNASKNSIDVSLPPEGYDIITSVYNEDFKNFKY